jgi:starch phosphorylase
MYSWDRQIRGLFYQLDSELWEACGHNPKVFLRRISQQRLREAAEDRIFMEEYYRVLSGYDSYHREGMRSEAHDLLDPDEDLVAYFCAEYGVHESLRTYSGGLGILAGDQLKAASDLNIPFVAVGILYRQGYFTQTIDGNGHQVAHYNPTEFDDLPLTPVRHGDGSELHVPVGLPGREVQVRVWRAKVGHIQLYLLDTDIPENAEADRAITYQLYGGDSNTRIQQEVILGIGGVRALRALGHQPTVWHLNEGHASFSLLERWREHMAAGLDFGSAVELTASDSVFTTHTPVPAGHDIFDHKLMSTYFAEYVEEMGVDLEELFALGQSPGNEGGFNMTSLALRGTRFHNGVSRIHGRVASQMEGYIWPEVPPEDNPIGYVTNGVHVPTFLARDWVNFFDTRFGAQWRNDLLEEEAWDHIDEIPDHRFWSLRLSLKAELLHDVSQRATRQHRRNGLTAAQIERITRYLTPKEPDILTVGFARRFATYKRAALLFRDPERLERLVNDPHRPVMFIFAGKAHPHDEPGQQLIETIHDYARQPEFEGKIILLEGYDIALARKLVTGVDVWLNTPAYPQEASGTSGQKAGINGALNLSVTDGWWGEGYDGENGWAIAPHGPETDPGFRDREEANELMETLENEVIPTYYGRNGHGYPEEWVRKSKRSMRTLLPRFNAQRMVMDYVRYYYSSASRQHRALGRNQGQPAQELAAWKEKVEHAWPGVHLHRVDEVFTAINASESLPITVAGQLNGLDPEDLRVECLVGRETEYGEFEVHQHYPLTPQGANEHGEVTFHVDLKPSLPGLQYYKLRAYPYHDALSHPHETGKMAWL